MSCRRSSARLRSTFCSPRMLTICSVTASTSVSRSRAVSGVPTLTAMMMSAPIARAISTGRLRTSPPSTSTRLPSSYGANAPGTDIDARIADDNETPFCSTISLPVARSVAIAANGIGSCSRSLTPRTGPPSARRNRPRFCVPTAPRGNVRPPAPMPNSMSDRLLKSGSREGTRGSSGSAWATEVSKAAKRNVAR